jgi:hypothetical protein
VWWICHHWGFIDLKSGPGVGDYVRQRDDEEGIETSQSSKSERSDDSESFLIKSDAETDREATSG